MSNGDAKGKPATDARYAGANFGQSRRKSDRMECVAIVGNSINFSGGSKSEPSEQGRSRAKGAEGSSGFAEKEIHRN